MNTVKKISILTAVALVFLSVGCLVSCKQTPQNNADTAELQARLDDIMKEYQELQGTCDDYATQLAAKDSSIQAQAAEIQRLINQLNNGGNRATAKSTRASKSESARLRKLNAALKARQAEIADLQAQLESQTAELAALKAADGYADREALARLRQIVRDQDAQIVALTNDKVALTCSNDSLAAYVGYLLGQRAMAAANGNTEYAAQVSLLQGQVTAQQQDIARLQAELEQQTALLAEANANAQKAQADAEKAMADSKASAAQTKGNINKKLAQLQAQCDEYLEELERLRAENTVLKNENDNLRGQVADMKRAMEDVAVENAKMAAKVSRASILSASELSVTPLKRLSNGTGKPTNRASQTKAFRIEGYMLGNSVVEPGTVTVYAVLTSPSNVVLHNGTVEQKFDADGVRTTYTMVQAYEFTGQTRPFDMTWNYDNEAQLEAGIYRLTLYAGGNTIGVTDFKLK